MEVIKVGNIVVEKGRKKGKWGIRDSVIQKRIRKLRPWTKWKGMAER